MSQATQFWDSFDSFLEADLKRQKIADLLAEHRRAVLRDGKRCGDCNNWMKSRQCPREKNVKGYSRGPSCDAAICASFEWSPLRRQYCEEKSADRQRQASELGIELP